METWRNAAHPFADGGEVCHCGGRHTTAVNMSEVVLKNVKKIYPNAPGEKKEEKIPVMHRQ